MANARAQDKSTEHTTSLPNLFCGSSSLREGTAEHRNDSDFKEALYVGSMMYMHVQGCTRTHQLAHRIVYVSKTSPVACLQTIVRIYKSTYIPYFRNVHKLVMATTRTEACC